MNKELYISLIARQLSNELNSSQLKNLNSWLSESKDNANILNDFKKTWALTSTYKQSTSFNADTAFASFAQKFDIPVSSDQEQSKDWKKYLIGLLFLAFISIGFLFNSALNTAEVNDKMHPVTTAIGPQSNITLSPQSSYSEGKSIEINENSYEKLMSLINTSKTSSIAMNNQFLPEDKNFDFNNFSGQGFFDFNDNDNIKIIGMNESNSIISSNAAFNVQNYLEDNNTIIDVQSGAILFVDNDSNIFKVNEGQRAIFDRKSNTFKTVDSPKINPFKWHKGILVFDNTPLDEAFILVERFYGVNIDVIDESSFEGKNFTATLNISSSLNECLELINASFDMNIDRLDTRNIEISGIQGE